MPNLLFAVQPSGVRVPLWAPAVDLVGRQNWSRWTIPTPPLSSLSIDKTQFLASMRASLLVERGEGRPTQGPRPPPPPTAT